MFLVSPDVYVFSSFSAQLTENGQPKEDEAGVALAFASCGVSSTDSYATHSFTRARVLRGSTAGGDHETIYSYVHN